MYDWSYFDREISKVANAGKKVLLRILSGGQNTPQWVFDAGAQTFSFVDLQTNTTVTIPVWWDPLFLEKKKNFIVAMGRHFTTHPNIVSVLSSCANATPDDWAVPTSSTDIQNLIALGDTSEKLINACRVQILVEKALDEVLIAGNQVASHDPPDLRFRHLPVKNAA